jgi:hypothetical protein
MRSRLACVLPLCTLLLSIGFNAACVTTSADDPETVPTASDVEDPASVGEDNVPVAKPNTLALGPIEDIDIKEVIYQGLEKQMLASETETTKVEIGDFESFKFSIIKMNNTAANTEEIPSQSADEITVEVTGWYKKGTVGDEASDKCFSFDSQVNLSNQNEIWIYDEKAPLKFTRENTEDCY